MDFEQEYTFLANILLKYVPEGWKKAWISFELLECGLSKADYDYIDKDGNQCWIDPDFPDIADAGRCARGIKKGMIEAGNESFTKCRFIIYPDGNLSFDIEHSD